MHHSLTVDAGLFKRVVGAEELSSLATTFKLIFIFKFEGHGGNLFNFINDILSLLLFLFVIFKVE